MAHERRHDMRPGGGCVCPRCGRKLARRRGVPCQEERCPGCGAKTLREGSHYHELFEEKKKQRAARELEGFGQLFVQRFRTDS